MKISSNARIYVERIKQELDPDTFQEVMASAWQMTNLINICHLESSMNRIIGKSRTGELIHSKRDRERSINAVGTARMHGKLPHVSEYRCSIPGCNRMADDYHHWSYLKKHRLCVIPLCNKCHGGVHSGRIKIDNPQSLSVWPEGTRSEDIFILDATASEKEDLQQRADEAGVDVSEYIRLRLWSE